MKAIVYYSNGSPDVMKYVEVEKPSPGPNQVLIKVRAAGLNPVDLGLMKGAPLIARKLFKLQKVSTASPGRPGSDVAGEVEVVGKDVTQFKPGDAVFGSCKGSLAEYTCADPSSLVTKPDNVSFEEAAGIAVAALTALQGLRDHGHLRSGQSVLINGAAGGVGTFAVQVAKTLGAQVTAVCSTGNVDRIRSLGAANVIDYTKADFTKGTERYDVIFDLVSTHSLSECRRVLNRRGIVVIAGAIDPRIILMRVVAGFVLSRLVSQKFVFFIAKLNNVDLANIRDMIANGGVKPIIDKQYSLSEAPQAMRYLETKHAKGKIVITMGE